MQRALPKNTTSPILVLGISLVTIVSVSQSKISRAEEAAPQISTSPVSVSKKEESTWSNVLKKTRVRSFTEYMTPSINNDNYVPAEDGSKLTPTNAFNITWIDYE